MTSTKLRRAALISLTVTAVNGCASGGSDGPTECPGGECGAGLSVAQDPFKDVGDIETREFEFIVVGSGAGGGPLAANLARQGHSVLLLEAGAETGGKTEYMVPVLHPTAGARTRTPGLCSCHFRLSIGRAGCRPADRRPQDQ